MPDRKKQKQKENTIYAINLHFLDIFLKLNWLKTNLILESSDVKVSLLTFIQLCPTPILLSRLGLKSFHSNLQFLKKKKKNSAKASLRLRFLRK